MKGIFITGTDTNVGKTYIACQIAEKLKQKNIKVIPKKPVETGCTLNAGELLPADANLLLNASAAEITLEEVCSFRFAPAISPDLAAKHTGKTISLDQLVNHCTDNINDNDFLIVEGAGGIYSPICNNALNADLARELGLPIVLVAQNRLGAVNQVLLAINAIDTHQLKLNSIILNTTTPPQLNSLIDNAAEIKNFTQHTVFNVSYNQQVNRKIISHLF
jgi:dethiobiotin synthetase